MNKLLIALMLLTPIIAEARTVNRGNFTSDGNYIMDYQRNDYKSPRDYNNPRNSNYNSNLYRRY